MSKYAKASILIVRIIGLMYALYGMAGLAYWYLADLMVIEDAYRGSSMETAVLSSLIYAGIGLLVFVLAAPLGKYIGKGLEG